MIIRSRRSLAVLALLLTTSVGAQEVPAGDWPLYARDAGGQRYVPLEQIDRANVDQLERAWEFRLRPDGGGLVLAGTVPVVVDGVMYLPLGDAVVALEAHTGRELWRHQVTGTTVRRHVAYWPGDGEHGARLFYNGGNEIVAISAETGELVASFGDNGRTPFDVRYSYSPSIFRDVLVIGASTPEVSTGPLGNTRAFSAVTGEMLWSFNTVPQPGEVGHETWLDDGWRNRPGNNMWVWYSTFDEETGLLFMTLGSPAPNYYGGDRPGDNLFGNSVLAVDLQSGEYRWHFQTIHHDLWDWDLPAPPVLVDVTVNGETIPALSQTGKPGLMYILDRRTGEPVHGVEEHLVAAADVPGEWYSPTQPIPTAPAPLSRMWWNPTDVVTVGDTTAEHAAACRALLDSYGGTFFNAGPFTPFFLHEEGDPPRASINLPHNGGSNWGGSAVDPRTGYVFINTTESGSIGWIEARDPDGNYGRGAEGSTQPYDRGSLSGPGAYSSFSASFTAEDGTRVTLPCIRPPWGRLLAVDANSGEIAWASNLGTTPQLGPERANTGSNNTFGGPMVTAGGLVFIGATDDRMFRAFDSASGELVWQEELEYAANTIPMSYLGSDGRQYLAVVAAGSGFGPPLMGPQGPRNNESLIVWALSEESAQVRTPEGALLDTSGDLAYAPGELSEAQLQESNRALYTQDSMNVFRRFPREVTADMVRFYTEALALRSLNPIQLTSTQQMILTGVGSGQVKLSAGQQGDRSYDLSGGVTGGTGIRYLRFTFPDAGVVAERFVAAGLPAPQFVTLADGSQVATLTDPAGLTIEIAILPGASDHSDDGVGVGIAVSDLATSRVFYRDFVGLDEGAASEATHLGVTRHPFRHAETTLWLHEVGPGLPGDTGSSGIQYVVNDAALAAARGDYRGVAVETPLNRLTGFDLTTVWLNDPDGVTNYFAQVGPNSRTARGEN
ncbi:MAG: PQQ-binding-like beta-propeller repeat protein [Erythrobacter sp.]|nr:MAG: PQQ-binding-like beta-propeller repeat protein [Erythrobacter sp.]